MMQSSHGDSLPPTSTVKTQHDVFGLVKVEAEVVATGFFGA